MQAADLPRVESQISGKLRICWEKSMLTGYVRMTNLRVESDESDNKGFAFILYIDLKAILIGNRKNSEFFSALNNNSGQQVDNTNHWKQTDKLREGVNI